MGQALYRKYRSKSLDEIVGQEHITTTLKHALEQGRVSHAYLLTGPRGVGKTSIARILAHEINGLPYTTESHLDIIEIDAASNRRIDEIRDLRDRVATAPASSKYKVYIIDEVHMLTREAFNALLKTLEEPPAHVVFILATTESHKLPETIISRTQRYTFRPVPRDQVVRHLRTIADAEKITIDDDALDLVAEHGEGSFRDSISLLDQASSLGSHITRADVERVLGLAPASQIAALHAALAAHDGAGVVTTLGELYAAGYEPAAIASQLAALLRQQVLDGSPEAPQLLQVLQQLLDVAGARSPRQLLELLLLRASLAPSTQPTAVAVVQTIAPAPTAPAPAAAPAAPAAAPARPASSKPAGKPQPAAPPEPAAPTITAAALAPTADVLELWQAALNQIKSQYNTLYGIARNGKPQLDGDTLTIGFKFGFHQKRVNEAKNREIFADVISQLRGGKATNIVCVIIEPEQPSAPDVSAVSNIFGGAELLES